MTHITFDLETLGNTANAPIVQIGAVKFTEDGKIVDEFLRTVDITKLIKYPELKMDYSTIGWWLTQSSDAIHSVFNTESKVNLSKALHDFQKWIGKPWDYVYWSHATFDPPILANNFKVCRKANPIPYTLHRDIRTLTHLGGTVKVERVGIHHNALDDCIYQAKYISALFANLKDNKNGEF